MLVDTHCHLTMTATYKSDINNAVILSEITKIYDEATRMHVTKIIDVGTTLNESILATQCALQHDNIYAAIGIHPCDLQQNWLNDIALLNDLYQKTPPQKIVAIGECGIDLYHQPANLTQQKDAFYAHIELALQHRLPVIVHSRNAAEETLTCIDRYRNDNLRGVMHCFSYDTSIAHEVIQRKFVLGIGGTITYPKNNELRSLIQSLQLEHIVLETDAPFLPPQPWRGQKNYPHHIHYIAKYIAQLRNETFEQIAAQTTHNAVKLFNLL